MIPILYEAKDTSFTTNGLGRFTEAISCTVNEKRNDLYELSMTYPVDGHLFPRIRESEIILAEPAPGKRPQPFRIYNISIPMNGQISISAEHVSYMLNHIPVKPYTATGAVQALNRLKSNAVDKRGEGKNLFTFSTDITSGAKFTLVDPASMRNVLGGQDGSILDVYKGEYEWDRYEVILHKERGKDKSDVIKIRYGINLLDVSQELNIQETYTSIMPYYKKDDKITYLAYNKTKAPYAPLYYAADEIVESFVYPRTIPVDITGDMPEEIKNLQNEMINAAKKYISKNEVGKPSVNLTVSYADLKKAMDPTKYMDIYLCDTVSVIYPKLGISRKAKVEEVTYDVLKERYESITLGDAKVTLADEILGTKVTSGSGTTITMVPIPNSEIINIIGKGTGETPEEEDEE